MLNNKVLLTYKRKRFSYQTDIAHATDATSLSPNMKRGSPWLSSPKSEHDTNDEIPKNHHSQHVLDTEGMMQRTMQKDMGSMILRSRRVLSKTKIENISRVAVYSARNVSQNNMKDVNQVDASRRASELDYITCAEENSTTQLAVNHQIVNPINLNECFCTDGGHSSECPKAGAKMTPCSHNNNNMLWNGGTLKDHSVAQLITFSRRSKLKQDAGEMMMDINLNTAEKLSFSSSCSSHVIGANFSCEGTSQKFIVEEQVNSTPVLLENCIIPSSQGEVADKNVLEKFNFKVGDASDCPSEICIGSKIMQKFKTSSESDVTAVDASETLPKELLAAQHVDVVKDQIHPLDTAQSNSDNNNTFSLRVDKSGSQLNVCTKNSEKKTITFLTEDSHHAGIDLSVAPISSCQVNLEANKNSNDLAKNHRDSQSSSTPCCSFVLTDEENDARNKEIEWLESLENILRERKEDKGSCTLVAHDVKDYREGLTPTMIPNKSAEQSVKVQDIGIDFVNQLSFPQKLSLAKLSYPSSIEQQRAEKSTPFTDFLSRYMTSNLNIPLDLNTAPSSSGSHFSDKVHVLDRKLPYSSNLNSFLFKHKKITEKTIAEMMSSGRRDFFSDEPKKYLREWSEEELDFLWVGVRRHGVDNWKAILGDPKLHFALSRFPEDLALQWEQEQKKLLNGIFLPQPSLTKTNISSTQFSDGRYPPKAHAYVENPVSATETKLSLGDVFLHNENITKSSQFSTNYPPMTGVSSSSHLLQGSYSPMASFPLAGARHKKSSSALRTMYPLEYGVEKQFWERSGNEQKPAGLPAASTNNLPHWLKDVYGSRLSDIPCSPFFTAGIATSFAASNNDIGVSFPTMKHSELLASSKDLRGRGILKRKSIASQKNAGISRIEEASTSMDESGASGIKPSVVLIPVQTPASEIPASGSGASLLKSTTVVPDNFPGPEVPNDLVVIDSDASSEETISDDQNMRSYQDPEQID